MDGLDLLKKHWNTDKQFPQVDSSEIRIMLRRNSSSIVRWIFFICCLEFTLWMALSLFLPVEKEDSLFFQITDGIYNIVFYTCIFYFIFQFYTLLIQIKSTNNTRKLMESILAVRSNAHRYIRFNLFAAYAAFGLQLIQLITKEYLKGEAWGDMLFVIALVTILFVAFGLLFVWLYKLYFKVIYGFLLKRLNKNYEELIRLDTEDV